jgi:hypothetical protein
MLELSTTLTPALPPITGTLSRIKDQITAGIQPVVAHVEQAADNLTLFTIQHPLAFSLMQIAGPVALTIALQTLPDLSHLGAGFGTGIHQAGLNSQATPQPCVMPEHFTVPKGSSISTELWSLIAHNGNFSQDTKLQALKQVLADNTQLANPDVITAGTRINVPVNEVCKTLFPQAGNLIAKITPQATTAAASAIHAAATNAAGTAIPGAEITPIWGSGDSQKDSAYAIGALMVFITAVLAIVGIGSSRGRHQN